MYLTHSPWRFCWKTSFKATCSRVIFLSLSCYQKLKLTIRLFTGRILPSLLIEMQNISLRSLGMRRKQNFRVVFGFKSDTAALLFRFLSSPFFTKLITVRCLKESVGEFDKRLKLFLVGDHFMKSYYLSIQFCDDIQGRKLMLITLKTF